MHLKNWPQIFLIWLTMATTFSCSSDSSGTVIRQYNLIPDELLTRQGNPCLSGTFNNRTDYYQQMFEKTSTANGSQWDSFANVIVAYSDASCTSMAYVLTYYRYLVSTTASSGKFKLVAATITLTDQNYVNDFNSNQYLGITWQLNSSTDVMGRVDTVSNSIIYQSNAISNHSFNTNPASKTVFVDGVEYRWP